MEGVVHAVKLLVNCPQEWSDCVKIARLKFEKYFNHKVYFIIISSSCDKWRAIMCLVGGYYGTLYYNHVFLDWFPIAVGITPVFI